MAAMETVRSMKAEIIGLASIAASMLANARHEVYQNYLVE